jgi:4-hydroxy-2-oxoheptanedioate aldolase
MRENRLRTLWKSGGAAINGWLAIPSSFSAETMAHQGWDSLVVDLQHGVIDYQAAVAMLTAISTTNTVPLARVPWNDPAMLMKVLDAGAYGVICPMVNTRDDAERLVEATRYPPLGGRSMGPIRASLYGGEDYLEQANDTIVVLGQCESQAAVANIDAILEVKGLDGVYIGPGDLALSIGCKPSFDAPEAAVETAIMHVLARAKAHGKVACMHNAGPEAAMKRIEMGFQLVTVSSDARLLAAGAQQVITKMRGGSVKGSKTY